MGKTVNFGSTSKIEVANKTVSGVRLFARLGHTTANTAFTTGDFSWSGVKLKVVLKRAGKSFTLVEDDLRILGAASNFRNSLFAQALNYLNGGIKTLLAEAAGVKAIKSCPMDYTFESPINLSGDDQLIIQVNPTSGAIVAANVDTAASYISFEEVDYEGEGYEGGTPYHVVETIQASKNKDSYSLGDNVTEIIILNLDKTTVLSAAQVVETVDISSDKHNKSTDYETLLAEQAAQFPDATASGLRLQCFQLYKGKPLDNVKISGKLVSANVAASQNLIVYRRLYTDARLINLARKRMIQHARKFEEKLG